jgi:hypothetical protein
MKKERMNRMLKLVLIGFCLIPSVVFGQIAASFGPTIIRENIFQGYPHGKLGGTQLYCYNSYALKGDYTYKRFRVYTELGYLNQGFDFESLMFHSSGGGSSAYHSDSKVWRSTVDLSYMSYRISIGHVFGSKFPRRGAWGQITTGILGQYNHRLSYRESNQSMDRTVSYDTYMGPGGDVTIIYPTDYSPFAHLKYVIDFFQIGVEATGRVGVNRYFGEVTVALNSYDRYRTEVVQDNETYNGAQMAPTSNWCFNIGFKVGAYLNVKFEEKIVGE